MELKLLHGVQEVPGAVKLLDYFERPDSFIIVMERPPKSKDLFDYITEKKLLDEELARDFFKQIVETVLACPVQFSADVDNHYDSKGVYL